MYEPGTEEVQVHQGEELLDELRDIVESIDFARDLQTIGGLPTLRQLVACDVPSLRWRALDVLAACCANHATVQVGPSCTCGPVLLPHASQTLRRGCCKVTSMM
jgi:hypothetical protein